MGLVNFLAYLAIMMGIYAILSLSLNLQYGFTGLANFGHVAFFCLGAYTSTILVLVFKMPFIIGLLGAMVIAGLFGYVISIPTANLKEDYWAIATLAAAEVVRIFFLNEDWVVGGGPYQGGSFGIGGIPQPLRSLFSAYTYPFFYLAVVLVCVLATYLIINTLTQSPFGRGIKSIRSSDNPLPWFYQPRSVLASRDIYSLGNGDCGWKGQQQRVNSRGGYYHGFLQFNPVPQGLYPYRRGDLGKPQDGGNRRAHRGCHDIHEGGID